jgi:secondary thiamine-phosphate synthase enzyme
MNQVTLSIKTTGRGLYEITSELAKHVQSFGIEIGVANVFLQHTSASLTIAEKADATVLKDLETVIRRLAPDGDPEYLHNYEGDDHMAAHVRSVLTTNHLSLPIASGCLALGAWQGVLRIGASLSSALTLISADRALLKHEF